MKNKSYLYSKLLVFTVLMLTTVSPNLSLAEGSNLIGEHHLFFVHGIGGNIDSFGMMPQLLSTRLGQGNPGTKYISHIFEYDSTDPKATPDSMARDLGQFIKEQTSKFSANDRFSIIAHSQGGLISLIWYFKASTDVPKYESQPLPFIDAFVTLGSPFWGSKMASLVVGGHDLANFANGLSGGMVSKLGKRQMEEMAMGSHNVSIFRSNVANAPKEKLSAIMKRIRPLNIAGISDVSALNPSFSSMKLNSLLGPFLTGWKHFESDGAVVLSSARFDSIYTIKGKTFETNLAPYIIVAATHASPAATIVPDLSWVPPMCINKINEICDHPTFNLVLAHMMGHDVRAYKDDAVPYSELGAFSLSLKLLYSKDSLNRKEKIKVEVVQDGSDITKRIVLAPRFEVQSESQNILDRVDNANFRVISGYFNLSKLNKSQREEIIKNGKHVTLKISALGLKTIHVVTKLKPTFTTHIETNVEDYKLTETEKYLLTRKRTPL